MTATRSWGVVYRRPSVTPELWAVITEVPTDVTAAEVRSALESWQRWPSWQLRISPDARVVVVRNKAQIEALAGEDDLLLSWGMLAPVGRAIKVEVPSDLHAAVRRAAAEDGITLSAWVVGKLAAAVPQ